MASVHIFISHASKDDHFVKDLRMALESHQLPVWVDSRNLRGGAKLAPEISKAIKQARQTIVVPSPNTINSPWVRLEIQQALAVEKRRGKDGYRVIPLLLPGVEPSALALWFDEEPVGVKIELKVGSVSKALPQILAALGERLPADNQPQKTPAQKPVEELLKRALAAGEAAYAEAAYDIAGAHFFFGRALKDIGAAETALPPLSEARQRFQALTDASNTSAELMASVAITEAADCLRDLGRYNEAAAAYEEGIRRAEKLGDRRGVAVGRGQLGTVRLYQKRYGEALKSYREALRIFESLGEPGSVAIIWHQIGIAYREAGQFEQAEQSYRQSLAIAVQQQNRAGEARSLGELGTLYDQMGRLEEAAAFYRQAADIYARLQDQRYEEVARGNLANVLIKLQRYGEARRELRRAIECDKPFSHAAQPWTTWDVLHDLEQATGDAQAAEAARGQAIASYLAYRRAGGESQSNQARLFAQVFQAIQQGATTKAEQTLDEWSEGDDPLWAKTLAAKLQAILRGDRDPALAADPNLAFDNAVELQLLLEGLGAK